MTTQQLRAISIRQPFAELIVQGIKDVENRTWPTAHRGRLLIQASSQVDASAMKDYGYAAASLPRGALVGVVDLADCTRQRGSPWHLPGHEGWYLANPRRFSRPVPFSGKLGFFKVPAQRVRRALLSARRPDPAAALTLFSFGYWGWGGDVGRLVRILEAVERARGFEPPILVDIRFSRTVRSIGFRDDAVEQLLGFERYRWFRTLGNRSIRTGENRIRIAAPNAVDQLLDLALDARRDGRRIIFFCACEEPGRCHRQTVGELALRSARRRGVVATVTEWPGASAPTRVTAEISIPGDDYTAILGPSTWLMLPRGMPLSQVGLLSYGGVVRLRARGRAPVLVVLGNVRPRGGRFAASILRGGEESDEWNVTEASRAGRRKRFRTGHAVLQ